MSFTNNIIDTGKLPSTNQVIYQSLQRNFLNVMLIRTLMIAFFLILIVSTLFLLIDELDLIIYLIMLSFLISIFTLRIIYYTISFKHKGYALREKDIIYKTGYIWKSITTIPFNRIQHTEIKEDIISRLFSLQTVKFYTAGGTASDLSVKGLSREKAQKIKEFINGNLKEYED